MVTRQQRNGLLNSQLNSHRARLPINLLMKESSPNIPKFFRQLEDFIQSIPKHPLLQTESSNDSSTNRSLASPSILSNYLSHYSLDRNSIDHSAQYQIWQSDVDGYRIVEHRWQAKHPNGKHIILCHGYFDHTLLYGNVIRWALEQGYCIHGFDLPGHGLSSGEPASIESFDQYSRILAHIINREQYSCYLCLGQSTGCAIIINALLDECIIPEMNGKIESIVLLAPLARSIHWQILRWPYKLLRLVIPSIKRAFIDSSHDKKFNYFLHHNDPLQSNKLPLKWLGAMDEWIGKIKTLNPDEQLVCTIIQGTKDNTVDYHYNIQEIQRCLPQTRINYIEGAYHHLANESALYWLAVENALKRHVND